MTDTEVRKLLRQMKNDDSQRAFHRFYDLTYDRLFRIAYYFCKREEWAQEIVLDVFMNLWNQRTKLPEVKNIEDYCFVLTKNAALNYISKESKYANNELETVTESADTSCSPEELFISEELFAIYVKALDLLPQRCREVFIHVREEKKSYDQTAKELNITVNTVSVQLQKAENRLKELIRKFYDR